MKKRCGIFETNYAQDMAIFRTKLHYVSLILFLIFMFAAFPFMARLGLLSAVTTLGIAIVGAVGLNIVTGYCGQIQLGQAGYICLGGYITAMLIHHLNWPWLFAVPVSVIGTTIVGFIFAIPALRIKGFYIAMASMASYFVIVWVLMRGGTLTGGPDGIPVPIPEIFGISMNSPIKMYWLTMIVTVLLVAMAMNLARTRTGRAMIAVRDNDIVAEHMGINIFKYKLIAFSIGAAYGAVAGSLAAVVYGHIYYEQFPFTVNVWYLAYVIIGGMGSVPGTIFGVVFLKLLEYLVVISGSTLASFFPGIAESVAALISILFGIVIVAFLIYEPRGIYHKWDNIRSSMRIWPFPY